LGDRNWEREDLKLKTLKGVFNSILKNEDVSAGTVTSHATKCSWNSVVMLSKVFHTIQTRSLHLYNPRKWCKYRQYPAFPSWKHVRKPQCTKVSNRLVCYMGGGGLFQFPSHLLVGLLIQWYLG
jgi:hypothetical protein